MLTVVIAEENAFSCLTVELQALTDALR